MDSGYMPVTSEDFLFYWKFGPRIGDPKDAPIIFWTNGGPGCSSMEGAINELGPLTLFNSESSSKLYTEQLSDNPYSWNAYAHLVAVDQPRYVGYSYGQGPRITSSKDAGKDIVTFIKAFLETYKDIFGEDKQPEVYIAGESYAGHYVPAWSRAIMDDGTINFKGIALGNSCVDDNIQIDALAYRKFLWTANLLPDDYPWRSSSTGSANRQRNTYVGYTPNFYDYRVKKISCSGPCYDYDYTDYQRFLSNPEFTNALGVCPGAGDNTFTGNAGGCISMGSFDRTDSNDDYKRDIQRVLDAGLNVVFFYGKVDQACDYVGGREMVDSLQFKRKGDFESAPKVEGFIAGAPALQIQQGGGLTWIEIEAAGHMVPRDRPAAGFFAINHLVTGKGTLNLNPSSTATCPPCPSLEPRSVTSEATTVAATTCEPCEVCTTSEPCEVCEVCEVCTTPPATTVSTATKCPTVSCPTTTPCPSCPGCPTPGTEATTTLPPFVTASPTKCPALVCPSPPPPTACPTPAETESPTEKPTDEPEVSTPCPTITCQPANCPKCPDFKHCPEVPMCPPPNCTTSIDSSSPALASQTNDYPIKTVAALATALAIMCIVLVVVVIKLKSSHQYSTLSNDLIHNGAFEQSVTM